MSSHKTYYVNKWLTAWSALALAACLLPGSALALDLNVRGEAAIGYDDNVSRSLDSQKLRDWSLNVEVGVGGDRRLTERTRFTYNATLGTERFDRYHGLSRVSAGIGGELQYRGSADFGAATYSLFARSFIDRYESDLRDGYRHAFGLSAHASVTDRIDVSAAVTRNIRDGKSAVFDHNDYSGRVNVDYSLGGPMTLYGAIEYRRGDTVANGLPALAFVNIAKAIVADDVFRSPQRFAYRLDARTILTTLGLNFALSEGHSLDFSWRWVQATPTESPGFAPMERIRYRVNQYTLAYLIRF